MQLWHVSGLRKIVLYRTLFWVAVMPLLNSYGKNKQNVSGLTVRASRVAIVFKYVKYMLYISVKWHIYIKINEAHRCGKIVGHTFT